MVGATTVRPMVAAETAQLMVMVVKVWPMAAAGKAVEVRAAVVEQASGS